MVIDSFIDEKVKLRDDVDVSDEGKDIHSLEITRRNNMTLITTLIDEIIEHEIK